VVLFFVVNHAKLSRISAFRNLATGLVRRAGATVPSVRKCQCGNLYSGKKTCEKALFYDVMDPHFPRYQKQFDLLAVKLLLVANERCITDLFNLCNNVRALRENLKRNIVTDRSREYRRSSPNNPS
jgi:hypothetical protein